MAYFQYFGVPNIENRGHFGDLLQFGGVKWYKIVTRVRTYTRVHVRERTYVRENI